MYHYDNVVTHFLIWSFSFAFHFFVRFLFLVNWIFRSLARWVIFSHFHIDLFSLIFSVFDFRFFIYMYRFIFFFFSWTDLHYFYISFVKYDLLTFFLLGLFSLILSHPFVHSFFSKIFIYCFVYRFSLIFSKIHFTHFLLYPLHSFPKGISCHTLSLCVDFPLFLDIDFHSFSER